jgi:hypothetical protein
MIVAGREKGFPSGNHEWSDLFQLMVIRLVGQVHAARKEREAAGRVKGGSGARLHKGAGEWVHFMKAGECQPSLRGECVGSERSGHGRKAQGIGAIEKAMGLL